tara:strand:- start:193 stop:468 length:276 start_codon:yes stop_codon:yes gene_type:complete
LTIPRNLAIIYVYKVNKRDKMIRGKTPKNEIVIDLTGPDGNAFALMGYAKRYAKDLGLDYKTIIAEMTTGDYENLVQVFDNHFGEYVVLER